MRIAVTRVDAHRYATSVERDDGVELCVPGYAFMRALPHDLAHYVVESALRLDYGFWGSVHAGAKFTGMTVLRGRQKPHADERARQTEKQNAQHLSAAERLVVCFESIVAEVLDKRPDLAAAHLKTAMGTLERYPG